jgi:hypothetical protein
MTRQMICGHECNVNVMKSPCGFEVNFRKYHTVQ